METGVLIVGFVIIAGLLAGYITARIGPRWMLWTLWAACAAAAATVLVWAQGAPPETLAPALILVAVILPFSGCTVVAGLIGLVARRLMADDPAQ